MAMVSIQFGLSLSALLTVVANLSHARKDQGVRVYEGYTAFELYLCTRPLVAARQSPVPRCPPFCFLGSDLVRWSPPLPTSFLGLSACTFLSPAMADEGSLVDCLGTLASRTANGWRQTSVTLMLFSQALVLCPALADEDWCLVFFRILGFKSIHPCPALADDGCLLVLVVFQGQHAPLSSNG
jgi:hypothetical protein